MKQRSLTLNNNNFANFLEVCIISSLYFSHMKFCCMTYIMVNFLELYKAIFFLQLRYLLYILQLILTLYNCWKSGSTIRQHLN